MTNRYYIPDLPRLNINGSTYDSTAILGSFFDEFRTVRTRFCNTQDFKEFKCEYEDKVRLLTELRKRYTEISRDEFPAELSKLPTAREEKNRHTILLKYEEQDYRRTRKSLVSEINVAKKQLAGYRRVSSNSEITQLILDDKMAALQKLDLDHQKSRLAHETAIAENSELISKLEEQKRIVLSAYSQHINMVQAEVKEKRIWFTKDRNEKLRNQYEVANRALALIQNDPHLHTETVDELLALYPKYRRSEWEFDSDDEDETKQSSYAVISMLIKDNPKQTLAELVAGVSEWRQTCFVDAMITIINLRDTNNLFYYVPNRDGSFTQVHWKCPA